jgi:hypothetical protein
MKLVWLSRSMLLSLGSFPWLSRVIVSDTWKNMVNQTKRLDCDNTINLSRLIVNLSVTERFEYTIIWLVVKWKKGQWVKTSTYYIVRKSVSPHRSKSITGLVCDETMKRKVKRRLLYECRCDERLKVKGEGSTRPHTLVALWTWTRKAAALAMGRHPIFTLKCRPPLPATRHLFLWRSRQRKWTNFFRSNVGTLVRFSRLGMFCFHWLGLFQNQSLVSTKT